MRVRNLTVPVVVAGAFALGMAAFAVTDSDPVPVAAQDPVAAEPTARRVTVDAVGTVSATPDLLTLTMGVQVRAPSAVDALRQSSERAQALVDTLKGAGVAAVDIQTAQLSLWPQYDRNGEQIIGYQASQSVVAKLRDLERAGAVIDAGAEAVGDAITLQGVAFSIEDTGPLYATARRLAVEQARTQAEQLAAAAGAEVGQVLAITEQAQEVPAPLYVDRAEAADGAAVPIEPGSQTLRLTVEVVYELTG